MTREPRLDIAALKLYLLTLKRMEKILKIPPQKKISEIIDIIPKTKIEQITEMKKKGKNVNCKIEKLRLLQKA